MSVPAWRPDDETLLGRVYPRCGCRSSVTGQQVWKCPRRGEPGHGSWYYAVQVTGPDGRRNRARKGGFASRSEAERAAWELLELPGPEAAARMWTVGRWLEFWLSEQESRLRPNTVINYRSIVRKHLIPALGGHRLNKLNTRDVQRAIDVIARRKVRGDRLISASSVNRVRAVLRSALSEARRQGMVGYNAAWGVRMPSGVRPHAVIWTEERIKEFEEFGIRPRVAVWDLPDVGRFLRSVKDDPLFPLWWLVALRGPRRGEIAGLRWEDVDLVAGCFSIREQVTVVNGKEIIGPPKSSAGVRTLALDEYSVQLLEALREWQRRRFGQVGAKDRVFRRVDGRPVRAEWLTRRFKELAEEAGLPPVRLHDLRHCAAGAAGAAGVDLMTIQRDLGHASPVTTAETYWVVFLEVARRSVQATAALLLKHAKVRMSLEGASQA